MFLCRSVHTKHTFSLLLSVFTHLDSTQSRIRYIPQISLWLVSSVFCCLQVSGAFVMIIGRKEQRRACTQLQNRRHFYRNKTQQIGWKQKLSQTLNSKLTPVAEKSFFVFLMAWMFFTRVENEQKKQHFKCALQTSDWGQRAVPQSGGNLCQVRRVCASQEWLLVRWNPSFRCFSCTLMFWRCQMPPLPGFSASHHCQHLVCSNISVASPFFIPPTQLRADAVA